MTEDQTLLRQSYHQHHQAPLFAEEYSSKARHLAFAVDQAQTPHFRKTVRLAGGRRHSRPLRAGHFHQIVNEGKQGMRMGTVTEACRRHPFPADHH